jgi:signal transduction histidine kinase
MSEAFNPLTVMVVDDEEGMCMSIERTLRTYKVRIPQVEEEVSFRVITSCSAEKALERMESEHVHILLLDHKLPGMSGIELLERIGGNGTSPLTIIMTAYASIETAIRATKSGAFDFLAKPFTPNEIKSVVHKAAEHLVVSLQAEKLAKEKRRVRFEFISVLSHELKSPLNAVESYLNILSDPDVAQENEQRMQFIERCRTRVGYMRKMIGDLLDLTYIESGEKQRKLVEVNLFELAAEAVETHRNKAVERDIDIDLKGEKDICFFADSGEIEIVLNNLISNAVKYNRNGGKVEVYLSADEETVTISVSDNGIGMTEDEAGKLFQDFSRIKNKKTKNILGSGLGLSTVKKIALLYDGRVDVKSVPDEGSTFTVRLGRRSGEMGSQEP